MLGKRLLLVVVMFATVCLGVAAAAGQPPRQVDTLTISGTFIQKAEYDASARTLKIFFTDRSVYRYDQVPQAVFNEFRRVSKTAAASYFSESIRDKFKATKLAGSGRVRAAPAGKSRAGTGKRPPAPATPVGTAPKPPVPKGKVTCPQLQTLEKHSVTSVALDAVSYDPASRCLVVYFDSKHIYKYGGVPATVFNRLVAPGPDPAKYFNQAFWKERKYPAERVK